MRKGTLILLIVNKFLWISSRSSLPYLGSSFYTSYCSYCCCFRVEAIPLCNFSLTICSTQRIYANEVTTMNGGKAKTRARETSLHVSRVLLNFHMQYEADRKETIDRQISRATNRSSQTEIVQNFRFKLGSKGCRHSWSVFPNLVVFFFS